MRRVVGATAAIVVLLVIGVVFFSDYVGITGKASDSFIYLCINQRPSINASNCSTIINQSTTLVDNHYSCGLDVEELDNESYVLSILPATLPAGVWASINATDETLHLNATQDGVGAHNLTLVVTDPSGCTNSNDTYNYTVTFLDINDPPQLDNDVLDVTFTSGTTRAPYSLYSFFSDPDLDVLTFTVTTTNIVSITIVPSTGSVFYTSDLCGVEYLIFTATDPGNLSAESNIVRVESVCSTPSGGGGTTGSGGGSSGGGSSYPCTPKWKCDEWSQCFINNTRYKRCVDLNGCKPKDYIRYFWENCTYKPTCSDGIMNGDEEGIDCGGSCPRCGNCTDGIMNGDEDGVDCGGRVCEPCHDCSNGIQDWGEEDVDCGGPFCEPCATCTDGIKNQGETGIDCGGPCGPCSILELPAFLTQRENLLRLLLLLAVVLVTLGVLIKLYHRHLRALLAKLGWQLTKARRKQFLLAEEQKKLLLEKLLALDLRLEQKGFSQALMDGFGEAVRTYFAAVLGLPFVFASEDVQHALTHVVKNKPLRGILFSFYEKLVLVERGKATPDSLEARLLSGELRELVFQTSHVHKEDLLEGADELPLEGDALQRVRRMLYNIYLALQFEQLAAAKRHYLSMLALYVSLPEAQQAALYADVDRSYLSIRYQLSWMKWS